MRRAAILLLVVSLVPGLRALARTDPLPQDKAHVLDGSTVLTAGRLYVNITNWGLIGSRYGELSTFADAPSGQWPGGSSNEYLFAGGLWVGGMEQGEPRVSTGQPDAELRPGTNPQDTMYEAREGLVVRPIEPGASGIPFFMPGGDDDGDGRYDEEILDGYDQDHDGLIDEDFRQYGTQMFNCVMRDNTLLARQIYPDHRPLDIKVVQRAFSWQTVGQQDFVVLSYEITNIGASVINDVYLGFWTDCDIGRRDDPDIAHNDIAGGFDEYVRVPEGYFQPVRGGYMRDAVSENPLPGWFGVQVINHTTDQTEVRAPMTVRMHGMHIISAGGAVWGGGPPINDADRYQLLATPGLDPDVSPDHAYDYSFVVSTGPFPTFGPGETLVFEIALCVGNSREALLSCCATAQQAQFGRWVDFDHNYATGLAGHETLVCAEDYYPDWNSPLNPIYGRNSNLWNRACLGDALVFPDITPDGLAWYPDTRKHCIWVNMDNCEECERAQGVNCYDFYGPNGGETKALDGPGTGNGGRETHAPWEVLDLPPPAPSMRVDAADGIVRVFWDDRSEWTPDGLTGFTDFESYRLWRSDQWARPPGSSLITGPARDSWRLMAEYDLDNQYRVNLPGNIVRWLDFGSNTGLADITYEPACLSDPLYSGLEEAMRAIIEADTGGHYTYRPALRDAVGTPVPGLETLLPWETHTDVLDTFFAVIPREGNDGAVPKRGIHYYQYTDTEVHNGYIYFYAVTTTDHQMLNDGVTIIGPGIQGAPGANFAHAQPRFQANDPHAGAQDEVYVYPNPATRDALAQFQQMASTDGDPTGVRVAFAHLPACLSTIQIYTVSGDQVATFDHDGTGGNGQAYWNLMSRNNQEITSGIYLFVVTPHDTRFTPSIGKFVVVR